MQVATWILVETWQVLVRSTLHGACTCFTDTNALDSYHYTASNGNHYNNSATVKWTAGSQGGEGIRTTSTSGVYTFDDVPCGYEVTMTVTSTDHHLHGQGAYPPLKKCSYSHTESIGKVGNSLWKTGLHSTWETRNQDFALVPDSAVTP